ncbi:MAG: alkaline phosphatase family protein [Xenococcaceae cyanobacterium]
MKKPIIAIGLDAAEPKIIERWMSQGYLPNLARLRQQGSYSRLHNTVNYDGTATETSATERLWVMFGTGCLPNKTRYWGPVTYNASNYQVKHDTVNGAYDFKQYPPFYALGNNYRVAAFDVPVSALSEDVKGLQILGWGGHAPHTPSHSLPAEALPNIIQQYGKNPVLHQDYGYWWDRAYGDRIRKGLKVSTYNRAKICRDILQQEDWDLFITVFGETHSAGHDFWHLSQADNPLYPYKREASDPMLEAFQDVDRAIGEILAEVPNDTSVVVFAVHGMDNNVTDMFSMTFLPELLYRYNFPDKFGLARGKLGAKVRPPFTNPRRKSWSGEVWQRRYHPNPLKRWLMPWVPSQYDKLLGKGEEPALTSPYELREQGKPLNWMPAMWYQRHWSKMKAFALPAFAAGHIRINLQGREQKGIVALSEYGAVCNELIQYLHRLTDGRTGKPIVKDVVRTRNQDNALSTDSTLPDADLVVLWQEQPSDVVDSPDFGRIGPITYYRSGGHRPDGFLLLKSPNIQPNSDLPQAQAIDIAPTILELMGANIPDYMDGKSLLNKHIPSRGKRPFAPTDKT